MNPVSEQYRPAMSWDRFWQLIERLEVAGDGRVNCADLEDACATLAEEPVEQILGFGERVAEALFALDRAEFGTLPVLGLTEPGGSPSPSPTTASSTRVPPSSRPAAAPMRASSVTPSGSPPSPTYTPKPSSTSMRRRTNRPPASSATT